MKLPSDLSPKTIQRFWSKVERGDPSQCWLWKAGLFTHGYGAFRASTGYARYYQLQAHRVAYALHHNTDPAKWFVCHRCDNPICCNPAHLFLGSHTDNMRDMTTKGRHANRKGAANHNAKLTESDVVSIRRAWLGGEMQKSIAGRHGVDRSLVSLIVRGKIWPHVSEGLLCD